MHSKRVSLSQRNSSIPFGYEFNESRLKKCMKIMESLIPGNFLDIGATQGGLMKVMQQKGWNCSGIDINPDNVRQCENSGFRVKLCDVSIDKLPFKNDSFDLIFAGEIIEHIVDTDAFIEDMYRCLTSGGHLLLTTPNLASLENRARLFCGIYPEWMDWSTSEGVGHVRYYTPSILRKQLEKHRFDVEKMTGNFVPIIPQQILNDIQFKPLGLLGTLFPSLSQGIVCLSRKA